MLSPDTPYHVGPRALAYMILQKLKYPVVFAVILIVYGIILSVAHVALLGWQTGHSVILSHAARILYLIQRDGWFFTVVLAIFLGLAVVPEYHGLTVRLGETALYVRRGVLSYREIAIPYRQIQTINIIEKALPRMFGLCSLVVVTSAHDAPSDDGKEAEATLPLIHKSLAHAMQDELLRRSSPALN